MTLRINKKYEIPLNKEENGNNVFVSSINFDFVNYIVDVVNNKKDISNVNIIFPTFIFKDRYDNIKLDSVFDDKVHVTFRGINNELLSHNIFGLHKELLLYVSLINQGDFHHFIFKYTIGTNSIILTKDVNIMEDIFKYHEDVLLKKIDLSKYLHLDEFTILNMYHEKKYPKYEHIDVTADNLFNNFQYHYDLVRDQCRLNKYRFSSDIFISITRKSHNIFQYNLLMERDYYMPLLISLRIDKRKEMPDILRDRSLLYNIKSYEDLVNILPNIKDVLRYKIKYIS